MELPKNDGDLEQAKISLAMRFKNYEGHLRDEISQLSNSGFADGRLCAIAWTDIEKGFLALEKALRIGAPNDYAKAPQPTGANPFRPRVDPAPGANIAEERKIEDYRADGDLTSPR